MSFADPIEIGSSVVTALPSEFLETVDADEPGTRPARSIDICRIWMTMLDTERESVRSLPLKNGTVNSSKQSM